MINRNCEEKKREIIKKVLSYCKELLFPQKSPGFLTGAWKTAGLFLVTFRQVLAAVAQDGKYDTHNGIGAGCQTHNEGQGHQNDSHTQQGADDHRDDGRHKYIKILKRLLSVSLPQ